MQITIIRLTIIIINNIIKIRTKEDIITLLIINTNSNNNNMAKI